MQITVSLSEHQWKRVVLALGKADIEYQRQATYAGQEESTIQDLIKNAKDAQHICDLICDQAELEDIFRCR